MLKHARSQWWKPTSLICDLMSAQNCADARKSFELADDEAIKNLSQKLIDANC
jgi:hypothetical protein